MMSKLGIVPLILCFLLGLLSAEGENAVAVVKISAKKYEYKPREIILKRGVPVILQITSEDRSHGFNIPALNLRADVLPGKVSELRLTPAKSGDYDFFCDIFCGGGHEHMNGKIKVVD